MAKDKIQKTNAARLLDSKKIAYELIPYEVDENDLSAVHVASQLNESIDMVFKTLVLQGDRSGYFVCVIPCIRWGSAAFVEVLAKFYAVGSSFFGVYCRLNRIGANFNFYHSVLFCWFRAISV